MHRWFRIGLQKIHWRFRIGPPKMHWRFRIGPPQVSLNLLPPEFHTPGILLTIAIMIEKQQNNLFEIEWRRHGPCFKLLATFLFYIILHHTILHHHQIAHPPVTHPISQAYWWSYRHYRKNPSLGKIYSFAIPHLYDCMFKINDAIQKLCGI